MNNLKIEDVRIGDLLCCKKTRYPMKVVGIFADGEVYLDFGSNQGDRFEYNINELERVKKNEDSDSL